MEGTQKEHLFSQKWHIKLKGKGLDLQVEPSHIKILLSTLRKFFLTTRALRRGTDVKIIVLKLCKAVALTLSYGQIFAPSHLNLAAPIGADSF